MLRSCSVDLTLDLAAPYTARKLLCLLLPQWGVADQVAIDDAALVVSELVTNAFVHGDGGGGVVTVGVHLGAELVLSVSDPSAGVPLQRNAGADAENGRGLEILTELTSRWGVEQSPNGKRVVATLRVRSERSA